MTAVLCIMESCEFDGVEFIPHEMSSNENKFLSQQSNTESGRTIIHLIHSLSSPYINLQATKLYYIVICKLRI